MKNTLEKGSVRTIIFQEDGAWYGVGLDFNIVIEGDSPDVISSNLREAIHGYVASLRKEGMSESDAEPLLNQKADIEYEDLWNKLSSNKPIPSPYLVDFWGQVRLVNSD